ncbi:MAG: 3-phosphoshikimate 1-carboxyvinyltransferase, partial [Flavobacteriaceae bacterium]
MKLALQHPTAALHHQLNITGSKSESNRLLVLQALFPELEVANLSNADDVKAMLSALGSNDPLKDIHHAGTTMRFLTAYYATLEGQNVSMTGSQRMQERPIGILVAALRQLGATISYEKKEGYPPLRIEGKKIEVSEVHLPASVSSQYISALMLVAPRLEKGLEIVLDGSITSVPYIKMTQALLERVGIKTQFEGNRIQIAAFQGKMHAQTLVVESDWSSASYFYSMVALASEAKIELTSYRKDSLQGDAVLQDIYLELGVSTYFTETGIVLEKIANFTCPETVAFDLVNAPDLAQTIAVTCAGLGVGCDLTGLHTLKIKETDRLLALEKELTKLGAVICVTEDSLHLETEAQLKSQVAI